MVTFTKLSMKSGRSNAVTLENARGETLSLMETQPMITLGDRKRVEWIMEKWERKWVCHYALSCSIFLQLILWMVYCLIITGFKDQLQFKSMNDWSSHQSLIPATRRRWLFKCPWIWNRVQFSCTVGPLQYLFSLKYKGLFHSWQTSKAIASCLLI